MGSSLHRSLLVSRDDLVWSDDHSNMLVMGGELNGLVLAAVLFGIITCQTAAYFQSFKDNRVTQCLVLALVLLQFATICQVTFCLYSGLVTHMDDSAIGFMILVQHVAGVFLCGLLQSVIVQGFFLHRIWALSKSLWRTSIVAVPIAAQAGFGTCLVLIWAYGPNHDVSQGTVHTVFVGWLVGQVVADFSIAITISLMLLERRADIQSTNSLLNRLIVYTMSTGAITGVFSIIFALSLKASVNSRSAIVILMSTYGGVYPFAMLSNLHTRKYTRKWEMERMNRNRFSNPTRAATFYKDIELANIPRSDDSQNHSKAVQTSSKSGDQMASFGPTSNAKAQGVVINITQDCHVAYGDDYDRRPSFPNKTPGNL